MIKKPAIKVLIIVLVFFLFINSESKGSLVNANECTKTINPSDNLQQEVNSLGPGDVLCLNFGTYTSNIDININGGPTNPVTIQSTNLEQPAVIDCAGCDLGPSNQYKGIIWGTANNFILKDIIIKNSGPSLLESHNGIKFISGSNIKLLNVKVENVDQSCLTADNVDTIEVDNFVCNNAVMANVNGQQEAAGRDWGGAIRFGGFPPSPASKNITLTNCSIDTSWGEGVIVHRDANSALVDSCTLKRTWSVALYAMKAQNVVFSNNFVFNPVMQQGSYRNACLTASNEPWATNYKPTENITFENNIVVGCATSVWIDAWADSMNNVNVRNNTIIDPTYKSVDYRASNAKFENNIVYVSGQNKLNDSRTNAYVSNNSYNFNPVNGLEGSNNFIGELKLPYILGTTDKQNPIVEDFMPLGDSPVINNSSSNSTSTDILGCGVSGVRDNGALEYGGTGCGVQVSPTPGVTPSTEPLPTQIPTPNQTPSPSPTKAYDEALDLDKDGKVDILDVIFLIKYIFR